MLILLTRLQQTYLCDSIDHVHMPLQRRAEEAVVPAVDHFIRTA
jgi:hypothetical protein